MAPSEPEHHAMHTGCGASPALLSSEERLSKGRWSSFESFVLIFEASSLVHGGRGFGPSFLSSLRLLAVRLGSVSLATCRLLGLGRVSSTWREGCARLELRGGAWADGAPEDVLASFSCQSAGSWRLSRSTLMTLSPVPLPVGALLGFSGAPALSP